MTNVLEGMNKKIVIMLLIVLFSCYGCSQGTTIEVDAIIVKVVDNPSKMGCAGTYYKTIIRTEQGFTDYFCGNYGEAGDKIRGYWTTGHHNYHSNGFSFKLSGRKTLYDKEALDHLPEDVVSKLKEEV